MDISGRPSRRIGLLSRSIFKLVGADEPTLRLCSDKDLDTLRMQGLLLVGQVGFEAVVLSVAAHQVLASDDDIHFALIAGAIAVAVLIGLIDSYVFLRGGVFEEGISQLRRAGLDLNERTAAKVQRWIAVAIRLLFSVALALLIGCFAGLGLFKADIRAEGDRQWQQLNSTRIAEAKLQVDGEIKRATDTVESEQAHVVSLQKSLTAMREGAVNPAANDVSVQAQQQELNQLSAEKSRREAELVSAQTFASNELAGTKGSSSNTGVSGRGPVRVAAEERVRSATANLAAADRALADARARLDDLRKQTASTDGDRSRQAQSQLQPLEAELKDATAQLGTERETLTKLTANREENIRATVEAAPDHVARDQGLIGQLKALRRIAQDPEIATVIILIDVVSFMLELACVSGKIMSPIPTTFSALTVRDSYMRVTRIVDGMMVELDRGPNPEADGPDILTRAANDNDLDHGLRAAPGTYPVHPGVPTPPKRPRGRPRKPRPSGLN
jgi:Domain of unknown function (DUF4407)